MKDLNEVYAQITKERVYQDWLPHHSAEQDASTSVAAWIIYMEKHIQNAKEAIYFLKPNEALIEVRKATALGVACMQHNDTPDR